MPPRPYHDLSFLAEPGGMGMGGMGGMGMGGGGFGGGMGGMGGGGGGGRGICFDFQKGQCTREEACPKSTLRCGSQGAEAKAKGRGQSQRPRPKPKPSWAPHWASPRRCLFLSSASLPLALAAAAQP